MREPFSLAWARDRGLAFDNPVSLIAGNGHLYVTDLGTLTDPAAVFSVDPTTGARAVISGALPRSAPAWPSLPHAVSR